MEAFFGQLVFGFEALVGVGDAAEEDGADVGAFFEFFGEFCFE